MWVWVDEMDIVVLVPADWWVGFVLVPFVVVMSGLVIRVWGLVVLFLWLLRW